MNNVEYIISGGIGIALGSIVVVLLHVPIFVRLHIENKRFWKAKREAWHKQLELEKEAIEYLGVEHIWEVPKEIRDAIARQSGW